MCASCMLGHFWVYVCLWTNIMQFLSLLLCSKTWGQGLWFPQKFFYCEKLFSLCWILWFFFPNEIEWLFPCLCRIVLGFWWGLHWICRLPMVRWPFLLRYFCQSMSMGDLSIFWLFFDFFAERLEVLSHRSFACLVSYSKIKCWHIIPKIVGHNESGAERNIYRSKCTGKETGKISY